MRAVSLFLVAGIFAVSGNLPHGVFRYEQLKSFRRHPETCRVCYGDDCTTLAQSRCDYYVETENIMDGEEEGDGEETEVDDMVYDLVEHATQSWTIQECLPLISGHTDCTKDNICLGCKSCHCSSVGRWICKQVQHCRGQPELDVDQQVLVATISALENYEKSPIKKRSIKNEKKKSESAPKETSLVEIAEWMYGAKPNMFRTMIDNRNASNVRLKMNNHTVDKDTLSTKSTAHLIATPETDYLDFDEVLKNIANEGRHYRRRKPQLRDNNTNDVNADTDDIQIMKHNESDQFLEVLNALEEGDDGVTEPIVGDATFVVNLFAYNGNDRKENNDTDDIMNILNKGLKNTLDSDNSNYRIGMDTLKKKRDVSSVINITSTTESTTGTTTEMENNVNNTVLIPLSNIITEKQNELNDLLQIKENLLNYMNINNNTDVSGTKDRVVINGSNTYFSIYKLDLIPEISTGFRRNNPNTLDKLLFKLKRDIYEVRRDIAAIQKISETNDLPNDLKVLINAMKKYNHRQRNSQNEEVKGKALFNKNSRRNYDNDDMASAVTIKSQFIDILEVIKKNMPQTNVMVIISRDAKKIIKRVVNQHYVEETPLFTMRLSDSEYNITSDLKSIGNSWIKLTLNVENSPPSEMLYALKLLHLTLGKDINKLNDALSLIDFAQNRRMVLIEGPDDTVMDKINKGLDSIRNKVQTFINIRNRAIRMKNDGKDISVRKIKKKSFMQKLRNLLRSSKKDIIDMTNKNIPKSEIVKTIAKKKLDELAENRVNQYEQTMLRWQSNLNVMRKKRSNLNHHQ